MEEEESSRGKFLKGGERSQLRDSANKQTTIRIWSRQELLCRQISLDIISSSAGIGQFKSSLEEEIRNVTLKPEPK
jgi:hypothetical protein